MILPPKLSYAGNTKRQNRYRTSLQLDDSLFRIQIEQWCSQESSRFYVRMVSAYCGEWNRNYMKNWSELGLDIRSLYAFIGLWNPWLQETIHLAWSILLVLGFQNLPRNRPNWLMVLLILLDLIITQRIMLRVFQCWIRWTRATVQMAALDKQVTWH